MLGEFDDSGDLPRLPPARIGGTLTWSGDAYSVWVDLLNAASQNNPGDFETETDGYTRWNLGADYRLDLGNDSDVLVFVKWKNIGDEEIRLSTSFLRNFAPEAGESIEAGIRFCKILAGRQHSASQSIQDQFLTTQSEGHSI